MSYSDHVTAEDNLTADHSGMKLGLQPFLPRYAGAALKLDDFITPEIKDLDAEVDNLSCMSSTPLLSNDVIGLCVYASGGHLTQAVTARMGRERVPHDEEVIEAYSKGTGYVRGQPETDRGARLYEFLKDWQRDGYLGVEIEGFCLVNPRSWRKMQLAIRLFGGILQGADLPLIAERQNVWQLEMGQGDELIEPGRWGGHAYAGLRRKYEYSKPVIDSITWGGIKRSRHTFSDAGYVREAWAVLFKGWTPPNTPGFDRDRLLNVMRQGLN